MKILFAVLLAFPLLADSINYVTASSDGVALTMQLAGFDGSGQAIEANFRPGDIASVPICSCADGAQISVIEAWDGLGWAMVDGVMHQGKEGGITYISGTLPAISGDSGPVSFPITWSMDLFFFEGINLTAPVLFELRAAGSGTATANLRVIDGAWNGDRFTYASAPEPATLLTLGVGLMLILKRRRRWQR